VGEVRRHEGFSSAILGNTRPLFVYLPSGYREHGAPPYPVLYMQDGQNIGDTSPFHPTGWRMYAAADALLQANAIEPLLIVGVANAESRRSYEYLPEHGAELYGRMLVEEVKPFIDRTYHTTDSPLGTGIGGASFGAVVSLFVALRYPELFGNVAALSTTVWSSDFSLVKQVQSLQGLLFTKLWLEVGTNERGDESQSFHWLRDNRKLRDALVSQGWVLGGNLHYAELPGGTHDEPTWATRVPHFLTFLFPPRGN
jgi:enterochelin esterase-like enzyme